MSDTIRWCWTCGTPEWTEQEFRTCAEAEHDVADALVVRADQDVYRIDLKRIAELEDHRYPITEASEALESMIDLGVLVRIGTET